MSMTDVAVHQVVTVNAPIGTAFTVGLRPDRRGRRGR